VKLSKLNEENVDLVHWKMVKSCGHSWLSVPISIQTDLCPSWMEPHHASEDKATKRMSSMPWCAFAIPFTSVWKSKAFSFHIHMVLALHNWSMSCASTQPEWTLAVGSPTVTEIICKNQINN